MASWRFDPPFDVYDPALAAYDFSSILATLAPLSLLLGALSLLMFCVALIAIRRAAAKAMRSRDGLLDAFDSGRRWLPLFMVLQTLLIFGGMISLLSFEVLRGIAGGRQVPENTFKLLLIGGLIALLLLWYGLKVVWDTIRFARRQQELDPIIIMGQSLAPERAPLLWDFVREVAQRGRAQLPDSVVVGLNEGFFVTEHPVVLANGQRVPEGRVLYLPLPYMAFMSREEVAAVIAHELGHFTGEDTSYGRRFTPIYRALVGSIFAISNEHDEDDDGWRAWVTAPATLYGKWFLQNFDEAVHHHSRVRELAADAFSARSVSADAAALALLRSAVLFEIIDEALAHNHAAPPGQREGVLPMVRRLVAERGLSDPLEHLDDSQPHPLDTHPPLKQRLDALGIVTTAELLALARDTGCVGLLTELGLEAKPAA
jgi:Zn-dependent protease with chaperone function